MAQIVLLIGIYAYAFNAENERVYRLVALRLVFLCLFVCFFVSQIQADLSFPYKKYYHFPPTFEKLTSFQSKYILIINSND